MLRKIPKLPEGSRENPQGTIGACPQNKIIIIKLIFIISFLLLFIYLFIFGDLLRFTNSGSK